MYLKLKVFQQISGKLILLIYAMHMISDTRAEKLPNATKGLYVVAKRAKIQSLKHDSVG